MKNITKQNNIYFEEDILQHEYEKVTACFDITTRVTPEPYKPAQNNLLSESAILQYIKGKKKSGALSLYLHIPFCNHKCRFCDLYSFQVPVKNRHLINEYIDVLVKEIRVWGNLLQLEKRSVTTIHFGGGSPLILAKDQFELIINTLKKIFSITNKTEIAIEITTSDITDENIKMLKNFNISRIHVGIQTLSDQIRTILGRREPAQIVREKLRLLLSENFITSVDMLYGLPLQSQQIFLADLTELMEYGVDGFALYELQISGLMNKLLMKNSSYNIDKSTSYKMLLRGKKTLTDAGFKNVFFNHYGKNRDKNLYFTYPQRQEDCLAFGTIADAQWSNVFFRHLKYKKYLTSIAEGYSGIDYGHIENKHRTSLRKFENFIMSAQIPFSGVSSMLKLVGNSFNGVFDMWKIAGLISENKSSRIYELTGSGCWLVSTMLKQIRRL